MKSLIISGTYDNSYLNLMDIKFSVIVPANTDLTNLTVETLISDTYLPRNADFIQAKVENVFTVGD